MPKKEYDGPKSVGAAWKGKSKKGVKYLTIILDGKDEDAPKKKYVAFENENKKSENSPDFRIIESTPMKKKKGDDDEDETEEEDDDKW